MEANLEGRQPSNGGGLGSPTSTAKGIDSTMMHSGPLQRLKRSQEELWEQGPAVLTDNVSVFLLIFRIP